MDGFFPKLPKVFIVIENEIVDTRSGLIVYSAPNPKDARIVCDLKNIACQ